jgi:uncharacterized peroxidase-related enzyme
MTNASSLEGRAQARPSSVANINVVEEADARPEVAQLFAHYRAHFGRPTVPGIVKCFATHPALLRHMMGLAESFLFVDGDLTRRHKEMIATLISSENACPYCADSHGYFLRTLGGSAEQLAAIEARDVHSAAFSPGEQALLGFARKVTVASHAINRKDVDALLEAGWSEPQIAEAIHIASLFAAFNRIANAFGLPSQHMLALLEPECSKAPVEPR